MNSSRTWDNYLARYACEAGVTRARYLVVGVQSAVALVAAGRAVAHRRRERRRAPELTILTEKPGIADARIREQIERGARAIPVAEAACPVHAIGYV